MAACCDAVPSQEAFAVRSCFTNPVGYDLMINQQKIVGGALRCTRGATLYQGSIQGMTAPDIASLSEAFLKHFRLPAHVA